METNGNGKKEIRKEESSSSSDGCNEEQEAVASATEADCDNSSTSKMGSDARGVYLTTEGGAKVRLTGVELEEVMEVYEEVLTRASKAYNRFVARNGGIPTWPSLYDSYCATVDGKLYAVLRNCNGILAVYLVREDTTLKRVEEWPASIKATG